MAIYVTRSNSYNWRLLGLYVLCSVRNALCRSSVNLILFYWSVNQKMLTTNGLFVNSDRLHNMQPLLGWAWVFLSFFFFLSSILFPLYIILFFSYIFSLRRERTLHIFPCRWTLARMLVRDAVPSWGITFQLTRFPFIHPFNETSNQEDPIWKQFV